MRMHALTGITVAAHRVVHGGMNLAASCLIDQKVEQEMRAVDAAGATSQPRRAAVDTRNPRGVEGHCPGRGV